MDNFTRRKRKTNPRDRACFLSKLTFGYSFEIFNRAFHRDLEERDLYEVLQCCKSEACGDRIEKQWKLEIQRQKSPSIFRVLFSLYGIIYLLLGLGHLSFTIFSSVIDPYAISNLIGYFKKDQTEMSKSQAIYFALLLIGRYILYTFYWQNILMLEAQTALQIRSALSSLIYRSMFKLKPNLNDLSLGNIVTLITRDVYNIEEMIWIFSDAWNAGIKTIVISYLLYHKMGNVGLIGIGFLLVVLPFQLLLARWIISLRLKTGKRTDARLQQTQEALSAIKIVKMYTWETFFKDRITATRKKEVYIMMVAYYQQLLIIAIGVLSSKVGFYILIMTYIWLGYPTSTELIFYILSLYGELNSALSIMIPFGMARAAEMYASVIRIGQFLNIPEIQIANSTITTNNKPYIEMQNLTSTILHNVNCTITNGLNTVTGYVGSGKSMFLKTILKEHQFEGVLKVEGTISYASQEPWLFPSSIKQNILFGNNYNDVRYNEVLRVCALKYDLEMLSNGDETVITDRGMNLSKGQQARINLARAIYKDSDIYLLDDCLTALDTNVQKFIFNECIRRFLKDKICVLVTQNISDLDHADQILMIKNGTVSASFKLKTAEVDHINTNLLEISKNLKNVNNAEVEEDIEFGDQELAELQKKQNHKIYSEQKKQGKVSIIVYQKYILLGGGFIIFLLIIGVYTIAQFTTNYSDKLLTDWVDLQQNVSDLESSKTINSSAYEEAVSNKNVTINLYSVMILSATLLDLFKYFCLLNFCRKASAVLHKNMIWSTINAQMYFFDNNFIGNIINRFSQDLCNVDEHLPPCFIQCTRSVFAIAGTAILLTTVNYIFIIPIILFFIVVLFLRCIYLKAARGLKRLESATRSPMIGYLNATLEGLTTIRAYNAEQVLKNEFDLHQDHFSSARFTLITTTGAFGFFTDGAVSIFIVSVISILLFINNEISAGNAGLVLTQLVGLAGLIQWGMRQWSDLENRMTAVERALEYTSIDEETKTGTFIEKWPQHGLVVFKNVSLNFTRSGNTRVLNNINFTVKSMDKIGIVGRTGAGKSSLITALFRIYDFEGHITIDNVDIKNIALKCLRQNIAIIPQDPILFSGTIRSNIDPDNSFTDLEIWIVIKKVNLDDIVADLQTEIGSCNYSAGQKQMICLARAIIRQCKIIVLDEATSNMDPQNEKILQTIMKEQFKQCTVFIIAHRLDSVLDCNNVMVLKEGELIEFGNPQELLQNANSNFYRMVYQFGHEQF